MFRASLSGQTCFDPLTEAQNLRAQRKPVPPEFDRACSFLNPRGETPAQGWVLLLRSGLDSLDLNALHDLTFEYEDEAGAVQTLKWYQLVIAKEPLNLTPSLLANDPDSVFLVELADSRHRARMVTLNKQYNVRDPAVASATPPASYTAASLNGASAWTWQTLVGDLWTLMGAQLGSPAPTLPITPDGTPEGWIFPGLSAWDALNRVLTRIGCTIRADLTAPTNQYSIVQTGAADTATDTLLTNSAEVKIHDGEYQPIVRGRVPYGVRVYFRRQEQFYGAEETAGTAAAWASTSLYAVDVAGNVTGAEPGTYVPLWDTLPALYDTSGTLTNSATLAAGAQARADDYFRKIHGIGGDRLWQRYSGLLDLVAGSTLKSVGWKYTGDVQGGVFTEIVRTPDMEADEPEDRSLPLRIETFLAKATGSITARSGTTLGSGPVTIQQSSAGGVLSNSTLTATVYNPTTSSISSGTYVELIREPYSGLLLVTGPLDPSGGGATPTYQSYDYSGGPLSSFTGSTLQAEAYGAFTQPGGAGTYVLLKNASVDNGGLVSTEAQSFAGIKTFMADSFNLYTNVTFARTSSSFGIKLTTSTFFFFQSLLTTSGTTAIHDIYISGSSFTGAAYAVGGQIGGTSDGTDTGGLVFKGGLYLSGSLSGTSMTIGSTPVSGGTAGQILTVGSGPVLGQSTIAALATAAGGAAAGGTV